MTKFAKRSYPLRRIDAKKVLNLIVSFLEDDLIGAFDPRTKGSVILLLLSSRVRLYKFIDLLFYFDVDLSKPNTIKAIYEQEPQIVMYQINDLLKLWSVIRNLVAICATPSDEALKTNYSTTTQSITIKSALLIHNTIFRPDLSLIRAFETHIGGSEYSIFKRCANADCMRVFALTRKKGKFCSPKCGVRQWHNELRNSEKGTKKHQQYRTRLLIQSARRSNISSQ